MQYEGKHFKRLARSGRLSSLAPRASLSEVYHENTKLTPMGAVAYGLDLARIAASPLIQFLTKAPQKVYSLGECRPLAKEAERSELERIIGARRSIRQFTGEPLTLLELSRLLRCAYGVTNAEMHYRAVPSGGALYPLELYVLALSVEGLERGIYHFDPLHDRLDVIATSFDQAELERVVSFRDLEIENAAAVVVISAIFVRSTIKYKDRGYRLLLFEAGAVSQNLCLAATAQGLGACLLGGFLDDDLSRFLGFDGYREAPLIPVVLGRPRHGATQTGTGDW